MSVNALICTCFATPPARSISVRTAERAVRISSVHGDLCTFVCKQPRDRRPDLREYEISYALLERKIATTALTSLCRVPSSPRRTWPHDSMTLS
jgi:hypothetical protein